MLIICKTSQVRRGGCRWTWHLCGGWEIRWQRLGCSIVAELPRPLTPRPPQRGSNWPW